MNEVNEIASVVIDDKLQSASEQGLPLNFDVPPIIKTHHPSPPPSTSIVSSSPSSSSTQSLLSPGGFHLVLHPEPSSVLSTPRKVEATHGVSSIHKSKRNKKHSKIAKENRINRVKPRNTPRTTRRRKETTRGKLPNLPILPPPPYNIEYC